MVKWSHYSGQLAGLVGTSVTTASAGSVKEVGTRGGWRGRESGKLGTSMLGLRSQHRICGARFVAAESLAEQEDSEVILRRRRVEGPTLSRDTVWLNGHVVCHSMHVAAMLVGRSQV